ncbi:SDR family NAD(P)-dependent oxidoreductase [Novosphingobium panipatense]|uniref:NAD(P)-dependent dehydrogenase, short-chain alcohol dehydrogenase family n=1 Tax=Novosphingobium panipatense TaxID=428991 RepID=A0ABY1Q5W6_9SPHN|nr:SDR family NAD(P)-dependent oxidoreductase [Novosphingobium panipatense]SMP60875.1 NAD(P)-dependent dehydrogenase, short-chain alcohol dehydrogenase family [Novosphingobium panipatense]
MPNEPNGRVAVVTGAGGGVGNGIARRLAAQGASVIIAEFDEESGSAAARELVEQGLQARFEPVDVTDRASVNRLMARAGKVDILVNNAWRGSGVARIERKTDEQFDAALRFGVYATQWTMQAVFPHMKAQGWGRIINIASLNGVNAHMGSADYNAAKEALRALTRTAAREWAPYGICCNVICPAAMAASTRRIMAGQPEMMERIEAANPMGRMGDPEADIGGVAAFLASDDCRYVTGNTLFVDGGAHINGVAWAPDLGSD